MSRITKIQRWLNRLESACNQKKWVEAVSEADCLSAEVKLMREELWEKAEAVPVRLRICEQTWFCTRVVGIALIIICLTTLPISTETENKNIGKRIAAKGPEIILATTEEKELLAMLRTSLIANSIAQPSVKPAKRNNPPAEKTVEKQITTTEETPSSVSIATEDLLTLVQIGGRELYGNGDKIKILDNRKSTL